MSSRGVKKTESRDDFVPAAPAQPGQRRVSVMHAPVVDNIELPPRSEVREVEDVVEEQEVKKVVVPHVHIREEFQEVDVTVNKPRYLNQPRVDVLQRKIQIPKPVKQQHVVEFPQLHVVDRVTEKFQDIVKEKLIEKPKFIIQERIVPIPKRKVEEHTVRVPKEEFERIVGPMQQKRFETTQNEDGDFQVTGADGQRYDWEASPGMKAKPQRIGGPKYRHLPRPVEVPMLHYKPVPVERIVDRNVPVPVELNIKQEFLCPVLVPTWTETAVPVNVTRVIEKPVPADAFASKNLMKLYTAQTQDVDKEAEERDKMGRSLFGSCKGAAPMGSGHPIREKMTEIQIRAAGLDTDWTKLKSLDSTGFEQERRFNASDSFGFLTKERSMLKDKTPSQILEGIKPEGDLPAH